MDAAFGLSVLQQQIPSVYLARHFLHPLQYLNQAKRSQKELENQQGI
jgi:hypothetical protein